MINSHVNPFICKLIKFYGPPSLHPQESFDELTISHVIFVNIFYLDFIFSMSIIFHATHWIIDHNFFTQFYFHPTSHSHLLQTLTQLGIHYVQVEDDQKIKNKKSIKELLWKPIYIYIYTQKIISKVSWLLGVFPYVFRLYHVFILFTTSIILKLLNVKYDDHSNLPKFIYILHIHIHSQISEYEWMV